MRFSTFFSLAISVLLAAVAVFAVRAYLLEQQTRLATQVDAPIGGTLVVAAKPLRFGDRLVADNIKVINWPSEEMPEGAFASVAVVVGDPDKPRFAMQAIDPGEPVLNSKITGAGERASLSASIDKGMKAVSIRVNDVLGVAGFIRPSDRVDVLLTRSIREGENNDEKTLVDVLLQGVKVLAVDQVADERDDKPSIVKTVTFEVNTEEAQRLTLGANIGILSLALRNIASSDVEQTKQLTAADLGGGPVATELENDKKNNPQLVSIEQLVKKVGDDLGEKINKVENKLVTPEVKKVAEAPEIVVPAQEPVKPVWSTIGVWNTTTREEHRVGQEH